MEERTKAPKAVRSPRRRRIRPKPQRMPTSSELLPPTSLLRSPARPRGHEAGAASRRAPGPASPGSPALTRGGARQRPCLGALGPPPLLRPPRPSGRQPAPASAP
eukprot:4259885-Pyramimonas_sp.AAC.1